MTCTCWDKAGVTCAQCSRDEYWSRVSSGDAELPLVDRDWERDDDE